MPGEPEQQVDLPFWKRRRVQFGFAAIVCMAAVSAATLIPSFRTGSSMDSPGSDSSSSPDAPLTIEQTRHKLRTPDGNRRKTYLKAYPTEEFIIPSVIENAKESSGFLSFHLNDLRKSTSSHIQQTQDRQRRHTMLSKSLATIRAGDKSRRTAQQFQTQVVDLAGTSSFGTPRLVLVGDQSIGKSTLAMLFGRTKFSYTSQSVATKCPVEVRVRQGPRHMLTFNGREVSGQSELLRLVTAHMENLVDVVTKPVTVEIIDPDLFMEIDWIDLPGVPDSFMKERHDAVMGLIRTYSQSPTENIIVYVFDVNRDPENADGMLLSHIDKLKAAGTEVVAFGNFANLMLRMSANNAANRVAGWSERMAGSRIFFGGVEVTDEMKAMGEVEFKEAIEDAMEQENRELSEMFRDQINPNLIAQPEVPLSHVGVANFGKECYGGLAHSRHTALKHLDAEFEREDQLLKEEEIATRSLKQQTLGLNSVRSMLSWFGRFTRFPITDDITGVELEDYELSWIDHQEITPVFQTIPEAQPRIERFMQSVGKVPYPPPMMQNTTEPIVVEWDIPVASNVSDEQAPMLDSLLLDQQMMLWLAELQSSQDMQFVPKLGHMLREDLYTDYWLRLAKSDSGPDWMLFEGALSNHPRHVDVMYLTELYPRMLKAMSQKLRMEDHYTAMGALDAYVVRETVRAVVYAFLVRAREPAAPLLMSDKLAAEFNAVLLDEVHQYMTTAIKSYQQKWNELLNGMTTILEPAQYRQHLSRWSDANTTTRASTNCLEFSPIIRTSGPKNADDSYSGYDSVITQDELQRRHYDKYAECCRLHLRVRQVKYDKTLREQSEMSFRNFFVTLEDKLRKRLVERPKKNSNEMMSDDELLSEYGLKAAQDVVKEKEAALAEAREELAKTRSIMKEATPILEILARDSDGGSAKDRRKAKNSSDKAPRASAHPEVVPVSPLPPETDAAVPDQEQYLG